MRIISLSEARGARFGLSQGLVASGGRGESAPSGERRLWRAPFLRYPCAHGTFFSRRMNSVATLKHSRQENAHIACRVNGEPAQVSTAPCKTLLEMLREDLRLTGVKHGCELGECGACAVLVDGKPVLSCLMLALEAEGRAIDTIEGLAQDAVLHPLQAACADLGGAQCGYCTPGILLTAKALLEQRPNPTRAQIRAALSGNLCRCTGYQQIFEAVEEAILRQDRAQRQAASGSG